jgi:hypothetical protein
VSRGRRSLPVCAAFLAQALAACRGGPAPDVTVSDSAGIRITLSTGTDRTFALVEPEPVLSLGGADAAGATQFFRIAGVYVDRRGNVWVADGASAELRLFRADGTHWKTRGGQGAGPGEFRRLRLLGAFGGDSVACWDDGLARLTVFDGQGELARTTSLPPGRDPAPRAYAVFPDGTLLAQFPRMLDGASLEPGHLLRDTTRLERVDLPRRGREAVAEAPGPTWLWTGHSQIPLPFTVNPAFDLDGESLHLAAGHAFRVRVLRDGRLVESYGVMRNPREVTAGDVASYVSLMEGSLPEPQRREYLSVLDHPSRPRHLPAYSHVVATGDGSVWARVYAPDLFAAATWDVFDGERRWRGQVRTPAGFMLDQVRGDIVVGVWRDSLGVEHVRLYRIARP